MDAKFNRPSWLIGPLPRPASEKDYAALSSARRYADQAGLSCVVGNDVTGMTHKPENIFTAEIVKLTENCIMSHRKQPSRRKLAPTLGAAGLSLSLAGGVSAAAPTADIQTQSSEVSQEITFYDEEISDVGLGTFSTFDKERVETYDVD